VKTNFSQYRQQLMSMLAKELLHLSSFRGETRMKISVAKRYVNFDLTKSDRLKVKRYRFSVFGAGDFFKCSLNFFDGARSNRAW